MDLRQRAYVAVATRTVLVIDDDEDVRAMLRAALDRAGFVVLEASDAEGALAMVEDVPPHLVLLEVVLPQVSGYELYELLRGRLGEDVPIIFVSGTRTDRYDRIAGLLLGADDYILKPFDPDELLARVRRLLRSAHPSPGTQEDAGDAIASLTRREVEVLRVLAGGATTAEIAHSLVISERTVGTHVQHILAKLGVRNRGEAIGMAYRAGLVSAEVETLTEKR